MAACRTATLLLLLLLLSGSRLGAVQSASVWKEASSKIIRYPPQKQGLVTCRGSAVCGLVQANAWGINTESFCECVGQQPCPLLWDPEDGRSVTHGSNQYKYCRQTPALAECSPGQLAMTDELVSYQDERLSLAHHEFIHCRCPTGHQLKQTDSQWHETADSVIIVTTKTCTTMPQCEPGQHCKLVTQGPSTTLVQVNCACAPHQTCPTLTERDIETQVFGRGSVRSILCR